MLTNLDRPSLGISSYQVLNNAALVHSEEKHAEIQRNQHLLRVIAICFQLVQRAIFQFRNNKHPDQRTRGNSVRITGRLIV